MTPSLVLHNNFLSFAIHSTCVSCLSFCTTVHMCYVVGAEWVHTTCHCFVMKSLPSPSQVHWALPRLVDTCWLLEDTLRKDEYGHFHANNRTSHLFFNYSFITYLALSCSFLSSGISPSFLSLYFSSCVHCNRSWVGTYILPLFLS